jgi:hypothetical protein
MRTGCLLLALLVLTPSRGLPSEKALSGMEDSVLLSLRISEAKKEKRRIAWYKSLARQRRNRRAGVEKPRINHRLDRTRRLTFDRFPSRGR